MLLMDRMIPTCVVTQMLVPRMGLGAIPLTLTFDGSTATYPAALQEVHFRFCFCKILQLKKEQLNVHAAKEVHLISYTKRYTLPVDFIRRSLLPSFFPPPSSLSSSLHLSSFPSSLPFSLIFVQLSVCENFHSPVPYDGPSFLRGYPLNSTAIHISWERIPPLPHNEKLLGYRIRYRRRGSQLYTEKNVTSNSTEVVISRLDFRTSYEIKVNGFNEVGHGPPGNLITVQTLQKGK